jgi:hypothetical protein
MSWFFKNNYEKLLVVLAAGVLALSLGWAWRQPRNLPALRKAVHPVGFSIKPIQVPGLWPARVFERVKWLKAPEQSAGTGWLYELFTPPDIFYDSPRRVFAVALPSQSGAPGAANPAGPSPVAKPGLFPLQLTGYSGTPNNYIVVLVALASGETVLARIGRQFPELGLTLTGFEVEKIPVEHAEPWPVYEVAGFATLRDGRTGAEIVLNTITRTPSGDRAGPDRASLPVIESTAAAAGNLDDAAVFTADSEPERSH